jgi:hypothetical protein
LCLFSLSVKLENGGPGVEGKQGIYAGGQLHPHWVGSPHPEAQSPLTGITLTSAPWWQWPATVSPSVIPGISAACPLDRLPPWIPLKV